MTHEEAALTLQDYLADHSVNYSGYDEAIKHAIKMLARIGPVELALQTHGETNTNMSASVCQEWVDYLKKGWPGK